MNPKHDRVLILVNSQSQKVAALHYLSSVTGLPIFPDSETHDFEQYHGVAVCRDEICGANRTPSRTMVYEFKDMHEVEEDLKVVTVNIISDWAAHTITVDSEGLSGVPNKISHSNFEKIVEAVKQFNSL